MQRVPFYNVPNLTGFKLKAYVPYSTPMIEPEKKVERQVDLTPELLEKIEDQIDRAIKGGLVPNKEAKVEGSHSR